MATGMMMASGLCIWSSNDLLIKHALRQAPFLYRVTKYARDLKGHCATDDLGIFFELIFLSFTNPQISTEAMKARLDYERTSIALRDKNPRHVFSKEIEMECSEYAPPQHRWEIHMKIKFDCDPQRTGELSDAIVNLLNETASTIAPVAFDNAVKALRLKWEARLKNNAFIAREYVNSFAWNGKLNLSLIQNISDYINALTHADIQGILSGCVSAGDVTHKARIAVARVHVYDRKYLVSVLSVGKWHEITSYDELDKLLIGGGYMILRNDEKFPSVGFNRRIRTWLTKKLHR